jgi:hypothetical protein
MPGEFREFQRTEDYGASSTITTGLVRMDPRQDHVRQKRVELPPYDGDPAVQVAFFSPKPEATPMVVWDLTVVPEGARTILKITGQTIDAVPQPQAIYFASFTVIGAKREATRLAGLPVGAIVAWYSAAAALPPDVAKSWAFCDGQPPAPGLPPTPAIHDGRFLRGVAAPASGNDTGGRPGHDHRVARNMHAPDGNGFHTRGECFLGATDAQEHLPPYHNVRFIIRFR